MKYEYKVIHMGSDVAVEAKLNELGEEGWKVVAASWDSTADLHVVYLMREKKYIANLQFRTGQSKKDIIVCFFWICKTFRNEKVLIRKMLEAVQTDYFLPKQVPIRKRETYNSSKSKNL